MKALLVKILFKSSQGYMSFKRYIEVFLVYGIGFWRDAERPEKSGIIRVGAERQVKEREP